MASAGTANRHWALVLAGGDGRRLQTLTREITGAPIPKQYCRLLGEFSLLEATLQRTEHFAPAERTLVVVNRQHLCFSRSQTAGIPAANVLVQPGNRDTGPGLLFGLLHLARRDPLATVAVFPSDHYVTDGHAFIAYVERAARMTDGYPENIAVLGIRPDHPAAGFGYLTPAEPLVGLDASAFHVGTFLEKPSVEVARSLLVQGGLWNSFVMVFRVSRMLELMRHLAPDEFAQIAAVYDDPAATEAVFEYLTPWNFSTTILSRASRHLVVIPVDGVHWSDWGTRESIERSLRLLNRRPPWRASGRIAAAA